VGTINSDVLPDDLRKAVESIEVYGPHVRSDCLFCAANTQWWLSVANTQWWLDGVWRGVKV
jgi:hypothetical protein